MYTLIKNAVPLRWKNWVKYHIGMLPNASVRYARFYPPSLGDLHRPRQVDVAGISVRVPSLNDSIAVLYEVFHDEMYRFATSNPRPYILDVGANIGLAALYFRQHHPESQIVCFEPHPDSLRYLRQNLQDMDGVEIVPKAALDSGGEVDFSRTASYCSRILYDTEREHAEPSSASIRVPTTSLRDWIAPKEYIDMLKMDIEGSEGAVFRDIADLLPKIRNVVFEYHDVPGNDMSLDEILSLLRRAGFRYDLYNPAIRDMPVTKVWGAFADERARLQVVSCWRNGE